MSWTFRVRDARPADLAAVRTIYAHHVLHGVATFEIEPPSLEEVSRRRESILAASLPYLVAIDADHVVGFAYAAAYRPRPAYRFTVEDSLYIAPDAVRRGAGRALLDEVLRRCTAAGARQMIAVIGDSANEGSIRLHRGAGFREAGVLRAVGWKHGRWVDTVLMQRELTPGG